MILKRQFLLANVRVQLLVILTFEWKSSAEQGVEKNAERPYISRWAGVLDLAHNFRSHVRWSSAEYFHLLIVRNARREAEVDQFDSGPRLIQEDVLKLDVPVRHVPLVEVVDAEDDLLPQVLGLDFRHLAIGLPFQVTMQGAAIHVFHN